MRQLLSDALGFMAFSGCRQDRPVKVDWPDGVKYEIFVMSYADSNGDWKGELDEHRNRIAAAHLLTTPARALCPGRRRQGWFFLQ